MSQLNEGQYDNCNVLGGIYTTNEFGEQVVVDVEVLEGVKRRVYLSMDDKPADDGGESRFKKYTVPVLEYLQFNGDFGAIAFGVNSGVSCYCQHKPKEGGGVKERWYINTPGSGFQPEPAAHDITRRANARWKAVAAPVARPAGKPGAPPGKPTPPPPQNRAPAPPASKAPPPPSKAPAPPAEKWDADRAWEELQKLSTKGAEPEGDVFWSTVKRVEEETSKAHADFGEDNWRRVMSSYPPF